MHWYQMKCVVCVAYIYIMSLNIRSNKRNVPSDNYETQGGLVFFIFVGQCNICFPLHLFNINLSVNLIKNYLYIKFAD